LSKKGSRRCSISYRASEETIDPEGVIFREIVVVLLVI